MPATAIHSSTHDDRLLTLTGAVATFGREKILDGVDLHVGAREIVTVVGPNGSGKTTLMRAALGLSTLDAGRVERRPGLRIGYVPQALSLDPILPLTVRRFVALSGHASNTRIDEVLAEVGAPQIAENPMRSLSGGETRRALLARALLRHPDLLVLDEPTAGVDVGGQADLYRLIDTIREREGCGVLLVSHDLHLVMASTDRVVCLNRHVCCSGTPEDIAIHPEYLALFGKEVGREFAVYSHDHDHDHDLHGNVAPSGDGHRHPHG